jgi:hypothetical protein
MYDTLMALAMSHRLMAKNIERFNARNAVSIAHEYTAKELESEALKYRPGRRRSCG